MEFSAITPMPSDEEAVAIVAAIELAWPRPVLISTDAVPLTTWRFSGRWWARPVSARRDRPFY
jgi:hypothetical protein